MHVWRERFARWFDPLARRCPLSPNAISVIALVLNVAAAGLLYSRLFLAAVACVFVAGLADAFDGLVARVQGKTSRFGDFLDHFADRVSDTLLVSGWLVGSAVRIELTVAAIVAVALNGYIGTQLEATWGQRRYDTVGRGEFVIALIVFPIASFFMFANGSEPERYAALTIAEWLAVLLVVVATFGIAQRFRLAYRMEEAP